VPCGVVRRRAVPGPVGRPPGGVGRPLAGGLCPRLGAGRPRPRPVSVALPVKQRPAVLQQPRRTGSRWPKRKRRMSMSTSRKTSAPASSPRPAWGSSPQAAQVKNQRCSMPGNAATKDLVLSVAQLSLQDTDSALHAYDAHVCSLAPGCAPQSIGTPPPCVTTDSCRVAPTPQPGIFGAPASSTFNGTGNLTPEAPSPVKAKAKPLTRAQKLSGALGRCSRTFRKSHKKRVACERQARKKYGAKKPSKKKGHR